MPLIPDVADGFPIETDWGNAVRDATVPVGGIILWTTGTAPAGFLLCDGGTASRSVYSDLFNVVGTTFGVGDGSTTFNVPDMRARFPLGYKSGDPDADPFGGTGGEAAHTLLLSEVPFHDHGTDTGGQSDSHIHVDAGHTHNLGGLGNNDFAGRDSGSTIGLVVLAVADSIDATLDDEGVTFTNLDNDYADLGTESVDHTHSIGGAGGGDPFPSMPPFLVLSFIIKT